MTTKLYYVFTQFCATCLFGPGTHCTTDGCINHARDRVAQPMANVVRLLGGHVTAMTERDHIRAQVQQAARPKAIVHVLLELQSGPRSLAQLAVAVYGRDTPNNRARAKYALRAHRSHVEPIGDGIWRMISMPEALRLHLLTLDRPEAAE